jgi:hypothetical protein
VENWTIKNEHEPGSFQRKFLGVFPEKEIGKLKRRTPRKSPLI